MHKSYSNSCFFIYIYFSFHPCYASPCQRRRRRRLRFIYVSWRQNWFKINCILLLLLVSVELTNLPASGESKCRWRYVMHISVALLLGLVLHMSWHAAQHRRSNSNGGFIVCDFYGWHYTVWLPGARKVGRYWVCKDMLASVVSSSDYASTSGAMQVL